MILLQNFRNVFRIPELARRLMFTLGVLVVYRIGSFIPVAGIDVGALSTMLQQSSLMGGLFRYLDLFTGKALSNCAIFALSIGPYITASIILQILSMTVPSLEALSKEGEYGRKQINQYTRYLALGLSVLYAGGILATLEYGERLILVPGFWFRLFFILTIATGAAIVMWLGEQISLFGLGNGSSVLMFANIAAQLPLNTVGIIEAFRGGSLSIFGVLFIVSIFFIVSAWIVFLEKGERRVPVQYARRVIGQRVFTGSTSFIPFKINPAGVMPAIMTSTALAMPVALLSFLAKRFPALLGVVQALNQDGLLYNILTFVCIVLFTYVYTSVIFNPVELADNLKKGGGFILSLRPGRQTAEYFEYLLTRICLVGALYLGVLVLIPNAVRAFFHSTYLPSGTSLLILIGVALELAAQMESYLIEHRYGSFLSSGRVKSAR